MTTETPASPQPEPQIVRQYRRLNTDTDRQALVEDIRKVRRDVRRVFDLVPKDRWYEPRYHGWSPAAMLGHLELMDGVLMKMVGSAASGFRWSVSTSMLHQMNGMMAGIFRRRLIETTLAGLERGEGQVIDFVLKMPPERYDRLVYDPPLGIFLTIEQALQEFFLEHWHEHLATMRAVDDRGGYEPSARRDTVV
jgi:hypothetical protein